MGKLLWIGELVKFLVASMKKGVIGSAIAMAVVAGIAMFLGSYYVEAKHREATSKIEGNRDAISEMVNLQQSQVTSMAVMQGTLQNIDENLKDLKEDSRMTKNRVWQIRQDQLRSRRHE